MGSSKTANSLHMDFITRYHSPLGAMTLASDGERLIGLWFDGQRHFAATLNAMHEPRPTLPIFDITRRWLDAYFSGKMPDFTPPIRLRATPFRTAVCNILLNIGYGETTTYGTLAQRYAYEHGLPHFSAQAVAGAVANNPISLIIPCHRVVGADGSLIGYAAGLHVKEQLLLLEANGKLQTR